MKKKIMLITLMLVIVLTFVGCDVIQMLPSVVEGISKIEDHPYLGPFTLTREDYISILNDAISTYDFPSVPEGYEIQKSKDKITYAYTLYNQPKISKNLIYLAVSTDSSNVITMITLAIEKSSSGTISSNAYEVYQTYVLATIKGAVMAQNPDLSDDEVEITTTEIMEEGFNFETNLNNLVVENDEFASSVIIPIDE